jgi:hypothetical protein
MSPTDAVPPGPEEDAPVVADDSAGERSLLGHSAAPPSTSDLLSYGPGSGKRLNYTSAVYGSVLAATVVVSSGDLRAPVVLAVLLLVSGLTFWIAHVYAATVAGVHGGWNLESIWSGMRHEWPVAFAAVPPAGAALICGLIPGVTVTEGVWAALIVCIVEQQLWGYAAIRSARLTGQALTRTVLLNVVMGFIIVALKLGVGGH